MKVITKIQEIKEARKSLQNKKIGFVPTMGGLHAGHLSLINRAKSENEITFVSVFLNPTQFNDKKDLETYPANLQDDITLLEKSGVDFLFAPDYTEMYPDGYKYKITENSFSKLLCGATRPGHFDGVLTVVMKLFNLVRPTNAYFGEKDFQQYKLLKGMAEAKLGKVIHGKSRGFKFCFFLGGVFAGSKNLVEFRGKRKSFRRKFSVAARKRKSVRLAYNRARNYVYVQKKCLRHAF